VRVCSSDLAIVHTQDPVTMKVLRTIRELLDKLSVSIYNEDKNHGTVKTIVVRVSHTTGEVQLTFVTNTDGFPGDTALITAINQALQKSQVFSKISILVAPALSGVMKQSNYGVKTTLKKQLWGKLSNSRLVPSCNSITHKWQ